MLSITTSDLEIQVSFHSTKGLRSHIFPGTYIKISEMYSKKKWPQAKSYYLLPKYSTSLKNSLSDCRGKNSNVLWVLYISKIVLKISLLGSLNYLSHCSNHSWAPGCKSSRRLSEMVPSGWALEDPFRQQSTTKYLLFANPGPCNMKIQASFLQNYIFLLIKLLQLCS